jgi:hypothetical protein
MMPPVVTTAGIPRSERTPINELASPSAIWRSTTAASNEFSASMTLWAAEIESSYFDDSGSGILKAGFDGHGNQRFIFDDKNRLSSEGQRAWIRFARLRGVSLEFR